MTDLARAHQRRRLLATAVLDVAVISIIRLLPERKDAVSLIKALPAGLRTPAMDALVALMAGGFTWPTLELGYCEYNASKIGLISEAIPLFPKVVVTDIGPGADWQCDDATFKVPFCGFINKYGTKITELKLDRIDDPDHRRELSRALTHCTGVKKAFIWTDQVDILDAVTSTEHRVAELELQRDSDETDDALPVLAPLQLWLASGHARRLKLADMHLPMDAAIGRVLAASPTLSHLRLHSCDSVVASFVARGAPLASIQELEIAGQSMENVARLVELHPTLKTLVLDSDMASGTFARSPAPEIGHCIMAALPHLSALEHLKLSHLSVCSPDATRPAIALSSTLRKLDFDAVDLSAATLDTILCWATSSAYLESVTFWACKYFGKNINCATTTLQRCLDAGVRGVSFGSCGISSTGVVTLAETLHATHAHSAFELDLMNCELDFRSVQALLEAITTCTNVSLVLPDCFGMYLKGDNAALRDEVEAAGVILMRRGRGRRVCGRHDWDLYVCLQSRIDTGSTEARRR